jgi:Flp pilus assembly protein TadD
MMPEEEGTPSALENAQPEAPQPPLAAAASLPGEAKPVLALPPFPGHGAPPPDAEDAFFSERTPPLFHPTPAPGTDPAVAALRAERSRLPLYLAAGVVGIGVGVYLMSIFLPRSGDETGTDPTPIAAADAGSEHLALAEFDAGEEEPADAGAEAVVAAPEVADAGSAVVVVPAVVDAGPAVVVAAPAKDAGATQVAAAPVDAGAVAVAVSGEEAEFEKLVNDGKVAIEKERWGKALAAYKKAVKLKPDDLLARTGLGIAQVMTDSNYKDAVPLLQEGVKSDTENAHAWLALGIAYSNLGRDAESKTPYSEYLRLKPRGATADEVRSVLKTIK